MSFIVRHAKKYCRYKYEVYDKFQIAWDRYNELLDKDESFRLSFIQPADQEIHDKILQGKWQHETE